MRIALGAKQKLDFVNGTRYDYMVTSWILNSISKDLIDDFIYTMSSRDLWCEITERFGKSNENSSVSLYFTHLKRLWDKLGSIELLMGLSESFNSVRDQILVLDPLPSINRTYSMAPKHDSQKEVLSKRKSESNETVVAFNQSQKEKQKTYDLKKGHCSHCNMDDHFRDTCFKLIGYSDWFKNRIKIAG
ncbi:hypothetical protein MANES_08G066250v8 [Manihot esculenta]|uniref:Uncharacterized protein n=1 Tax=Manihot esculenta TaxID=3983 RepID=A0ACB7H8L6_MANES|nr:hypothetical protein MANES_08G066250v8 [Manihot esculenta]